MEFSKTYKIDRNLVGFQKFRKREKNEYTQHKKYTAIFKPQETFKAHSD
jgi:hypothetical protein